MNTSRYDRWADESAPARRSRSLILVDDDAALLEDAAAILENAGFLVTSFKNADEALSCVFDRGGDVEAIFTDLQMPGHIDGLILAEIVARHWPRVAVVLTSGRVRPMAALPDNARFISKPWRVSQVLAALEVA